MAGTIVVDRIESDASYASTINVAGQITFSNTVNFGAFAGTAPVAGFYLPTTNNLAFTTASTERMRIDSTGNVGVGTNSPRTKLDVSGSIYTSWSDTNFIGMQFGSDTSSYRMGMFPISSTRDLQIYSKGADAFGVSGITFHTGSGPTERMRIGSEGQVGIGTTATLGNATLNVNQGVVARTAAASAIVPYYQLYNGNASTDLKTWRFGGNTNGGLSIETVNDAYSSASERMRITSTGLVGINTSSPSRRLHVASPSATKLGLATGALFTDTANDGGVLIGSDFVVGYIQGCNAAGTSSKDIFMQVEGGYLSVGNAGISGNQTILTLKNPSNGTVWGVGPQTGGSFLVYNGSGVGVYIASGSTSWSSSSDERTKTTITPFENALEKVCTLRAGTGRYLTDDESVSRSFLIAQDVQAVLPEAVNVQDDEQKTLGLSYTDLIPLLVAAIKEQQALITSLTTRITALETN